jgi:hypothetical protein
MGKNGKEAYPISLSVPFGDMAGIRNFETPAGPAYDITSKMHEVRHDINSKIFSTGVPHQSLREPSRAAAYINDVLRGFQTKINHEFSLYDAHGVEISADSLVHGSLFVANREPPLPLVYPTLITLFSAVHARKKQALAAANADGLELRY